MEKSELLKLLSDHTQARRFAEGELIVKEGSPAPEGICFVLSGRVRIFQSQGERNVPLGYIQAGEFFGETALVLNRLRGASAVVDTPSAAILFLDRDRFMSEARENFHLVKAMVMEARQRVEHILQGIARAHTEFRVIVDPSLAPIIHENRIYNLRIPGLLNHARHILVSPGKSLFTQGQRNDGNIFLVTKGKISAQRNFEAEPKQVFVLEEGDFFGYSRPEFVPSREYGAVALGDTAHVVSFDEELLFRLLRLDMHIFYIMFRSIITQLVILDDTFRLAVGSRSPETGSPQVHDEIMRGFEQNDSGSSDPEQIPPINKPEVPAADA